VQLKEQGGVGETARRPTASRRGGRPESEAVPCYHCGDPCDAEDVVSGGRHFCCNGCKTVYELLQENNLCAYYEVDRQAPGRSPRDSAYLRRFEFLDDESVAAQLLSFSDGDAAMATFSVPSMRCSSCVWLLERLGSLHAGVTSSRVNFPRKEVTISFRKSGITLRRIVELMSSIGYEPLINLESIAVKKRKTSDRRLYYRIGVAGFAFGNVMLLSFPEYLAEEGTLDPLFRTFFTHLNLLLSIPVLLYSSMEFFIPAWKGLRARSLNIDAPIALGIIVMFARSMADILGGSGPGFLDSFTGFVFFMLIGRIFQKKSYDSLSFDRDFRSFFPLWVTLRSDGKETSIPLTKLRVGDRIVIRNQELVPADSVLLRGDARIDYSFVTGEAEPVAKTSGDRIHAGGRQSGEAIELEVCKEISQSYLTRLWNDDVFTKPSAARIPLFVNTVSRYFTAGVLLVACAAGLYWLAESFTVAASVFTAVLIIACPCALALSSPFAFGSAQRILGNNGFYLKNTETVETLAAIDTIVFDKTGTLTQAAPPELEYSGEPLGEDDRARIASVAKQSTHVLSRRLAAALNGAGSMRIAGYSETPGEGIGADAQGEAVRIGSAAWTGAPGGDAVPQSGRSQVHVSIGGGYKGFFSVQNHYRRGLDALVSRLRNRGYEFEVLSGDGNGEENALRLLFGGDVRMKFRQSPEDKMRRISELQRQGRHVLMVGDGLNDAGALKAADAGVSVAEDVNTFSPACDAILSADRFHHFDRFLGASRASVRIVKASFALSLIYNVTGIAFAVGGALSPLVSAVLMPLSSVSAVAFTTIATRLRASSLGLR